MTLFVVYNSVAEEYGQLMERKNSAVAKREFEQNILARVPDPETFSLWKIGHVERNDSLISVVPLEHNELVCQGEELDESNENEPSTRGRSLPR